MDAQLGPKPFYAWISILKGRVVLEKIGLLWRVDFDSTIRINNVHWVTNAPSLKVQS